MKIENQQAESVGSTVTFPRDSVSADPTFTMCTIGDMLAYT